MAADERFLSALILAATAVLGLHVVRGADRRDHPPDPPVPLDTIEMRVQVLAEAIAIAEGYYADGEHDGRSLPYRLNNPGALKKPALGASLLPTWTDTGLVVFPTSTMGWAALRHQVRSMLTGTSAIYEPSDTLLLVAEKYADGDVNWAANVAGLLHVSPSITLEDLVGDR
jgi:hypothetical protein